MGHGKIGKDGYTRNCDAHGCHGPLYPCPEYPADVLADIAAGSAKLRANLLDPVWWQAQIDAGLPPECIAIFRVYSRVCRAIEKGGVGHPTSRPRRNAPGPF